MKHEMIENLTLIVKKIAITFIHVIRIITAPIRVEPDFLIIGAQKAGTTSLYIYLTSHPQIKFAFTKEVQFFDSNFHKGFLWYRSFFHTKIYKYFMKILFSRTIITGEASPYYVLHPKVAQRVYKKLPNIKIIILLRNPIDRAFSQYFHSVNKGKENLTFVEAIKLEEKRIKDEYEKLKKYERYKSADFPGFAYKFRGIYINQLKAWYELFPKNQIFIINSQDLFKKPDSVMISLYKFLGVPYWPYIQYKKYHSETQDRKMSDHTRNYLKNYFEPYNKQLFKFLDKDFEWN